jgi:hypothetical protein
MEKISLLENLTFKDLLIKKGLWAVIAVLLSAISISGNADAEGISETGNIPPVGVPITIIDDLSNLFSITIEGIDFPLGSPLHSSFYYDFQPILSGEVDETGNPIILGLYSESLEDLQNAYIVTEGESKYLRDITTNEHMSNALYIEFGTNRAGWLVAERDGIWVYDQDFNLENPYLRMSEPSRQTNNLYYVPEFETLEDGSFAVTIMNQVYIWSILDEKWHATATIEHAREIFITDQFTLRDRTYRVDRADYIPLFRAYSIKDLETGEVIGYRPVNGMPEFLGIDSENAYIDLNFRLQEVHDDVAIEYGNVVSYDGMYLVFDQPSRSFVIYDEDGNTYTPFAKGFEYHHNDINIDLAYILDSVNGFYFTVNKRTGIITGPSRYTEDGFSSENIDVNDIFANAQYHPLVRLTDVPEPIDSYNIYTPSNEIIFRVQRDDTRIQVVDLNGNELREYVNLGDRRFVILENQYIADPEDPTKEIAVPHWLHLAWDGFLTRIPLPLADSSVIYEAYGINVISEDEGNIRIAYTTSEGIELDYIATSDGNLECVLSNNASTSNIQTYFDQYITFSRNMNDGRLSIVLRSLGIRDTNQIERLLTSLQDKQVIWPEELVASITNLDTGNNNEVLETIGCINTLFSNYEIPAVSTSTLRELLAMLLNVELSSIAQLESEVINGSAKRIGNNLSPKEIKQIITRFRSDNKPRITLKSETMAKVEIES